MEKKNKTFLCLPFSGTRNFKMEEDPILNAQEKTQRIMFSSENYGLRCNCLSLRWRHSLQGVTGQMS